MRTPSSSKLRLDLAPPLADRFILGFPIDYGPVLLRRPFGFPSRWTPCPPKYCQQCEVLDCKGIRTRTPKMCQRPRPAIPYHAAVFENLLELGGGSTALPRRRLRGV
jgi:hypothetical protein